MQLVLVIMIKNEADSIESTLQPWVDAGIRSLVVFDTGSTDSTLNIVRHFFRKNALDDHLIQEPFIDFATSRNHALIRAEALFPDAAFFIMIDAEWYLNDIPGLLAFCKTIKNDETPLYLLKIKLNSLEFTTARLFRATARIRFKGVVHEVPEIPTLKQIPSHIYFTVNASQKSIEKTKQRWEQDCALLLKHYEENPEDPRTVFYLAQTYHCLLDLQNAFRYYEIRSQLPGWEEENFITLYRLGCVSEQLAKQGHDTRFTWAMSMDYFLKAFAMRPHRIEPIVKIADHYWPESAPTCYLFIRHIYHHPFPSRDILFIEKEMYDYTRYEIMSRCAWYVGEYVLGEKATQLALKHHPQEPHLLNNLQIYRKKINRDCTTLART